MILKTLSYTDHATSKQTDTGEKDLSFVNESSYYNVSKNKGKDSSA